MFQRGDTTMSEYVFLGMAIQAIAVAVLMQWYSFKPTASQQFIVACIFLIMYLLFTFVKKVSA